MKKLLAIALLCAAPAFATVSDTSLGRVTYTGANGSQTVFSFFYPASSLSDVHATVTLGTAGTPIYFLNSDQISNPGGTVTFSSAPTAGATVVIERDMNLDQTLSISPYFPFPAKAVERNYDRTILQIQQVQRGLSDLAATVGAGGGGSGVTSVGLSMPGMFSVSGSPLIAPGTISVSLTAQAKNTFLGGPTSGSNATPTFRLLTASDLPNAGPGGVGGVFGDSTHIPILTIGASGLVTAASTSSTALAGINLANAFTQANTFLPSTVGAGYAITATGHAGDGSHNADIGLISTGGAANTFGAGGYGTTATGGAGSATKAAGGGILATAGAAGAGGGAIGGSFFGSGTQAGGKGTGGASSGAGLVGIAGGGGTGVCGLAGSSTCTPQGNGGYFSSNISNGIYVTSTAGQADVGSVNEGAAIYAAGADSGGGTLGGGWGVVAQGGADAVGSSNGAIGGGVFGGGGACVGATCTESGGPGGSFQGGSVATTGGVSTGGDGVTAIGGNSTSVTDTAGVGARFAGGQNSVNGTSGVGAVITGGATLGGGGTGGIGAVITGGGPNGKGATITANGTATGGTITGGSPSAGSNGGLGALISGGTTNSGSNGLAGGFGAQIKGTNGTAANVAATIGGTGGYAIQASAGNGGTGNTSGAGGFGGDLYTIATPGAGGTGGATGNGGTGGKILTGTAGAGGVGGATSGTGGTGGTAILVTGGNGGAPGTATGTGGAAGAGIITNGGTGGAASGAGTGGQGGTGGTFNAGNGGATTGGTGGTGGTGINVLAGNGVANNGIGGDGAIVTAGNGVGTGYNGSGLRIGTGVGGTGTTRGWGVEITQNNTIHAHTNRNPLASIPSSLSSGDDWISGATTAMTDYVRLNGVTQPRVTYGANGVNALQTGSVAGCATSAVINTTCDVTITWPVAFPDANYKPVCTPLGITSGIPVPQAMITLVAASVTFRTINLTAAAAQFTTIYCTAVHN